jgi:ABC-2 type transport system permease protein
MKTMKWLIKREMWENKGMLLWTPIVVAAVVAILPHLCLLGKMPASQKRGPRSAPSPSKARRRTVMMDHRAGTSAGLPVLLLGLLVFFYCLGALHDERRDRSLLFWKSLPVSDTATVPPKPSRAGRGAADHHGVAIVLALAILVTCSCCYCTAPICSAACCSAPDLYLSPLRLLSLLPVYILWALPTVGWLLMVSSMARSKVFLWAVGTPLSPRCCWCGPRRRSSRHRCGLVHCQHHQPHPAGRDAGRLDAHERRASPST